MKILSLNAGSNSLKFEAVEIEPNDEQSPFGKTRLKGSYDDIGKECGTFSVAREGEEAKTEPVAIRSYQHAAELLFGWIKEGAAGVFDRIGHRVVHGADLFEGPARIDDEVIKKIESLEDLAPLHNGPAVEVIREAGQQAGAQVPMFAVFDTVFHRTIPDVAALYALEAETAKKNRIRRYGFHGISHRYMTMRYGQLAGRALEEVKLITLHLEGGSSAAAIRGGESVDTSMGFTPLEGLMMGTRTGDLDPAIALYLMRKEGMDPKGVEEFLNKKCGLLGVSGQSADTRKLREQGNDPQVRLALDMFSYRVRKYIGSYLAVLGGAEAIVFGGGIGENTPEIRAAICSGMEALGIEFDEARNRDVIDCEGVISKPDSRIQVWVVPTQEAKMVALETARCAV